MIRKWDNAIATHATLSEMTNRAGGDEVRIAQQIAALDEMVSASRGIVAMLMPSGTDAAAMSEDAKALLREAQAGIDRALSLRDVLERQRAAATPNVDEILKRGGVATIVENYAIAKSRFDDAVAGRLGKLSSSEQQKIRIDYSTAEAALIEARAR